MIRRTFMFAFVAALAFGSFAALPTPSLASAKTENGAQKFVENLGNEALTSLTAKDLAHQEREKRVRTLLNKNFDVQTIGRFALGINWKNASAEEKKEYLSLFEDMIVQTYSRRFEEYSGQQFTVLGALKIDEKDSIVSSQILQKDGPPVNLEWRVRNKNGQYRIIDVIVESISMSVTQRSDFNSVIQGGDGKIETLLAVLRNRKAENSVKK